MSTFTRRTEFAIRNAMKQLAGLLRHNLMACPDGTFTGSIGFMIEDQGYTLKLTAEPAREYDRGTFRIIASLTCNTPGVTVIPFLKEEMAQDTLTAHLVRLMVCEEDGRAVLQCDETARVERGAIGCYVIAPIASAA